MTGRGTAAVARLVLLLLVVAALAWCGWFRLGGGRWERVESPSMGTTAPVGTLLWVRPTDPDAIRVGDVISFHRPGGGPDAPVYSHRVRAVLADGDLETGGDLSGPDHWRVAPADMVGRVVRIWPRVGWLVLAAPLLLLGALATGALARLAGRGRREPVLVLGAALTAVAVLVVHRPLTRVVPLGVDDGAGTHAGYVATGVLPVWLSAPGATPVRLEPGQAGTLEVAAGGSSVRVRLSADVPVAWWLVLVGACFAPAVALSCSRRRDAGPGSGAHAATPGRHGPNGPVATRSATAG